MATIFGTIIDESKKPVEFATVFRSDANGKPVGNLGTTTDDKGRWTLKGLVPTDFITARMVGLEPNTVSVSKAVSIPNVITGIPMTFLNIQMKPSASSSLPEITVTAQAPKPTKSEQPKPSKEKEGMSKGLKIGLIVGGVLALFGIVVLIVKNKNK